MREERGSALLTAVVAVMVLLLISGVFFSLTIYKAKTETSEEKGLKAYYLAQAGLSYAAADVLQRPVYYFSTSYTPQVQSYTPHWENYGEASFDYRVKINEAAGQPVSFTVESIGYYPAKGSPQEVMRKLDGEYPLPKP